MVLELAGGTQLLLPLLCTARPNFVAHRVVSSGTIYNYVEDKLGTSRVITTAPGTVSYDADFYLCGRERNLVANQGQGRVNVMAKTIFRIITFLAFCTASFSQDASYYRAIQRRSSLEVQPAQFKKMEENALKDYSRPESYELLARSFGNTTEKVWTVIYGEVYCNLSSDSDHINQVGSLVYQWYDKSVHKTGNNLSIDLTENAQSSRNQVPFESQFELSFLIAATGLKNDLEPLSIQKLTEIRKNQLLLWNQKKLPQTELVRRQEGILSAGHFEAYNFWLFKGARVEEFNEWLKGHQAQFQAWLDWQSKNKFQIQTPDFHRLYLLHAP